MSIFRQWCHLFSLVDDDRCVLVPVDYCTENAVRQGARDTGELAKLVVWALLWIWLLFLYCHHCALRFSKQSLSISQVSQEPEGPAPCHQLCLQWEMWWHDMNVQMPTWSCIAKEPCLWLYCSLLWSPFAYCFCGIVYFVMEPYLHLRIHCLPRGRNILSWVNKLAIFVCGWYNCMCSWKDSVLT